MLSSHWHNTVNKTEEYELKMCMCVSYVTRSMVPSTNAEVHATHAHMYTKKWMFTLV